MKKLYIIPGIKSYEFATMNLLENINISSKQAETSHGATDIETVSGGAFLSKKLNVVDMGSDYSSDDDW